jgi:hypothetical protein
LSKTLNSNEIEALRRIAEPAMRAEIEKERTSLLTQYRAAAEDSFERAKIAAKLRASAPRALLNFIDWCHDELAKWRSKKSSEVRYEPTGDVYKGKVATPRATFSSALAIGPRGRVASKQLRS